MKRRAFLRGLTTVLAGSVGLNCPAAVARPSKRRPPLDTSGMNVLLINIDDLTAHAIGCYGNATVSTPNLDGFAGQAIRFDRCYCQAPMSNPSRSSFLTGLRPDTTRIYTNADPMSARLPDDTRCLPEILHQYKVRSANIGKLFHRTDAAQRQVAGFDRLEFCPLPNGYAGISRGLPPHLQEAIKALPSPPFRFSPDPTVEKHLTSLEAKRDEIRRNAKEGSKEVETAAAVLRQPMANIFGDSGLHELQETDTQKARLTGDILNEMARGKGQFFVSLGFSRPHPPLRCPKEYIDRYNPDAIDSPNAPPEKDRDIPAVAKRFGRNYDIFNSYYNGPVTDGAAREAIAAYYGCVSFIDAQIGFVLAALDSAGLADDTIVMIFSDHGFQLGEHGLWGKQTLFEQSTRVPLMIRIPGYTTQPTTCHEIVELVDLLPTLCELLALPAPEHLEGTSFAPLLWDPRLPWKKAAFTVCAMTDHIGRSVRTKRWRLTDWQSRQTSQRTFELYDLEADPWEQNNLALNRNYRNQRTLLANLLQRGWREAL